MSDTTTVTPVVTAAATVTVGHLRAALKPTVKAAGRNGALRLIRFAVGDGLVRLTGSDLDVTVDVEVAADDTTIGGFLIDPKLLTSVLKGATPATRVTLSAVGDDAANLTVTLGDVTVNTETMPVLNYPRIDTIADQSGPDFHVEVDAQRFLTAFTAAAVAISTDFARPALCTVNVTHSGRDGHLTLVATDSFRLACVELPGVNAWSAADVLVPAAAIKLLPLLAGKADTFHVAGNGRNVEFDFGASELRIRRPDADYPQWERFFDTVPANHTRITADRGRLAAIMDRAADIVNGDGWVRIETDVDTIKVTASTRSKSAITEERIPAAVAGDSVRIAFNPAFVADGLSMFATDDVTITVADQTKPAVFGPTGDPHVRYLLMPVRT